MFDMPFILQSPIAMLGLLTLLIPLGIHLLSKARPKVVAFAHIAFITAKTSPLLRQLRLSQLILLVIRILIFLLATLILARLYWHNTGQQTSPHILVTQDWLNHATGTEKQTLAEQALDANLILVARQNRTISQADISNWPDKNQQKTPINVWHKVADYLTQLQTNTRATVYTTNRLNQFVGSYASLPKHVSWQIKTLAIENEALEYSTKIRVIYDDASEPLLTYLQAATEIINDHKNFSLSADYINISELQNNSKHSLSYNKTINLSEHAITEQASPNTTTLTPSPITQAALGNIKQADFVFTLAQLLYSSQSHDWWRQNARLSPEQITQNNMMIDSTDNAKSADNQLTVKIKKNITNISHSTPLHFWLILMLVATFVLERVLSEWPTKRVTKGIGE